MIATGSAPDPMEPILRVEIAAPEEFLGDVMGDLCTRRARIPGMKAEAGAPLLVSALAPPIEMVDYPEALRSLTDGHGRYTALGPA